MRLAVYGTLKQGNHNYDVHLAPQNPITSNYYKLKAKLYTNGRYPMLVKISEENSIYLEIYEINEKKMSEIDALELPFGYHREKIDIGKLRNIWVYYYTKGLPPPTFILVEDGNFQASEKW